MTDKSELQEKVLLAALPHVVFDGWTAGSMTAGARDIGEDPKIVHWLFPAGPIDMIDCFNRYADRRMLAALDEVEGFDEMRVRDKVTLAVRVRLEQNTLYKEAVRRGIAFLALPQNAVRGAEMGYRTVNEIWYRAGDTATDHNFYTKRGLLAGVYGSTLLFWLNDDSVGAERTWAFLDRRIDEVMRVPKYLSKLTDALGRLPDPFRFAADLKQQRIRRPRGRWRRGFR